MQHDEVLNVGARTDTNLIGLGPGDYVGPDRRAGADVHFAVQPGTLMYEGRIIEGDMLTYVSHAGDSRHKRARILARCEKDR